MSRARDLAMSAEWIWDGRRKVWVVNYWTPNTPRYLGHHLDVDTRAPMDEWGQQHAMNAMKAEMESWLSW